MSLILASSSPFRKDILMKLGVPFVTTSPDIDESRNTSESPYNLVTRLSEEKALKASKTHSGLIIASDQVATLDTGNKETVKIFNQILSYLETENVLNCAGSFKSEGLGIALFSKMEGNDPNSLIGLPTIKLIQMLAKENVHIL